MNDLEKLRNECFRLFKCDTINDSIELIDIYSEFLLLTIKNHHSEEVYSTADADAKIVLQMMLTKALHLKSLVRGIKYKAKDGITLNKIIDPTIVASLIRNLYETVGMFNLIYSSTKIKDEKTILYCLWVHSGLKYRHRFESVITTEENQEKLVNEKKQIEQLIKGIEGTELYKKLDEKNQKKIRTKLKRKEYLLMFNGTEVMFLHWQELTTVMGIKNKLFDDIYTYFSLYSHPSNVAVVQFADMFKREDEFFLEMTNHNLKYFFALTSIFIADYIKLFPSVLKTFESLNIRDQIVIDYYNTFMRRQDFSINDSWKAVN